MLSEYSPGTPPAPFRFPERNRIVAALADATIVIEAAARSGALITVNQATDYGRPVYAVPGPIDRPSSQGCNTLIQNGARLVTSAADILDDLSWLIPPDGKKAGAEAPHKPGMVLTGDEKTVFETLGMDERQFDDLVAICGLPAGEVAVALMKLEMKKCIRQLPGRYFTRLTD